MNYKLNGTGEVAVDTSYFWNEDMKTCPLGAKVQLLGQGGVATHGQYKGEPFWVGWTPLPKRRESLHLDGHGAPARVLVGL